MDRRKRHPKSDFTTEHRIVFPQFEEILNLFSHTINQKLDNMAKGIDDIKKSNAETKAALENIAADIVALDAKIAEAATPQDLEDLKAESSELASRASSIAGLHPEAGTGGGETGGGETGGGTEPGTGGGETGGGTEPGTEGGTEPGTGGGETTP